MQWAKTPKAEASAPATKSLRGPAALKAEGGIEGAGALGMAHLPQADLRASAACAPAIIVPATAP